MRLNFSAVDENDIVEGMRRIGKVIDRQISLFGTISRDLKSGRSAGRGQDDRGEAPLEDDSGKVVHLPRRTSGSKRGASGS